MRMDTPPHCCREKHSFQNLYQSPFGLIAILDAKSRIIFLKVSNTREKQEQHTAIMYCTALLIPFMSYDDLEWHYMIALTFLEDQTIWPDCVTQKMHFKLLRGVFSPYTNEDAVKWLRQTFLWCLMICISRDWIPVFLWAPFIYLSMDMAYEER